jgi:hypothetical protein
VKGIKGIYLGHIYLFIYLGKRFYNSGTHLQGGASKEQREQIN